MTKTFTVVFLCGRFSYGQSSCGLLICGLCDWRMTTILGPR